MKRKNIINKISLLALVLCLSGPASLFAQDSTKSALLVNVGYYMNNNKVIYLVANAKTKIDGKFQPVANTTIRLYLDAESDSNFIGKVITDARGNAKAILPPALKTAWDASPTHTLLGISEPTKDFDAATGEITITKTRINIDTASAEGVRSIIVNVTAEKDGAWIPAPDVEMRVGINRLGGILSAGEEETYTTDSSGSVTVEVKKDSLPGDEKGNIVLAAKVEDNDQYGNLLVEKTVPWGIAVQPDKTFFQQRTLWSTRFHTPVWLLLMAYSIVIGVWSTIIYLVIQIVKIKKLSTTER